MSALWQWWTLIYVVPLIIAGDAEHDHDVDADQSVDPAALLLMAIGARQVTTGLALQLLTLTWGILGLVVNQLLAERLGSPRAFILPSLVITAVGSVLITRGLSTLLGKLIPKDDSADVHRIDLEGCGAQCLYSIDHDSGAAIVKDRYGHRHQVACRTAGEEIPRGAEVLLLEYVPERDYYVVEEVPDEWRSTSSRLEAGGAQDSQSARSDA